MTDAGYNTIKSVNRHVRTRLYFTSESHVHSLVNAFRYVGDNLPSGSFLSQESSKLLAEVSELDYLTHIVFRLYENFKVRRSTSLPPPPPSPWLCRPTLV